MCRMCSAGVSSRLPGAAKGYRWHRSHRVAGSRPAAILPSADTVFRERWAAPQRVITNLSQPQIHIIAQLQFLPFLSERSSVGRFQAVRGACRFSVSTTSAPPPASETLAEKTRKSRQPDDTDRPTDG